MSSRAGAAGALSVFATCLCYSPCCARQCWYEVLPRLVLCNSTCSLRACCVRAAGQGRAPGQGPVNAACCGGRRLALLRARKEFHGSGGPPLAAAAGHTSPIGRYAVQQSLTHPSIMTIAAFAYSPLRNRGLPLCGLGQRGRQVGKCIPKRVAWPEFVGTGHCFACLCWTAWRCMSPLAYIVVEDMQRLTDSRGLGR